MKYCCGCGGPWCSQSGEGKCPKAYACPCQRAVPDWHCVTTADGNCVGGTKIGGSPCLHDVAKTKAKIAIAARAAYWEKVGAEILGFGVFPASHPVDRCRKYEPGDVVVYLSPAPDPLQICSIVFVERIDDREMAGFRLFSRNSKRISTFAVGSRFRWFIDVLDGEYENTRLIWRKGIFHFWTPSMGKGDSAPLFPKGFGLVSPAPEPVAASALANPHDFSNPYLFSPTFGKRRCDKCGRFEQDARFFYLQECTPDKSWRLTYEKTLVRRQEEPSFPEEVRRTGYPVPKDLLASALQNPLLCSLMRRR